MKKTIQIISIAYCAICPLVISGLIGNTSKIFITFFKKENPVIPHLTEQFINNIGFLSTVPILAGLLAVLGAIICLKLLKKENYQYFSLVLTLLISTSISFIMLGSYILAMALPFININKGILVLPGDTIKPKPRRPFLIHNIRPRHRVTYAPSFNVNRPYSRLMPVKKHPKWIQIDINYKTPVQKSTTIKD